METTFFELDKHYRHETAVTNVAFSHSQWHDKKGAHVWDQDGVTSLLQIEIRGKNGGDARISCSPSVAELRRLAATMSAAADELEAHQRQIGGVA